MSQTKLPCRVRPVQEGTPDRPDSTLRRELRAQCQEPLQLGRIGQNPLVQAWREDADRPVPGRPGGAHTVLGEGHLSDVGRSDCRRVGVGARLRGSRKGPLHSLQRRRRQSGPRVLEALRPGESGPLARHTLVAVEDEVDASALPLRPDVVVFARRAQAPCRRPPALLPLGHGLVRAALVAGAIGGRPSCTSVVVHVVADVKVGLRMPPPLRHRRSIPSTSGLFFRKEGPEVDDFSACAQLSPPAPGADA
mmetsp:Transcript_32201/g.78990  ORF Transcript_32201/g.78990 Transcript_32201/m.78990 type:complete len:250 (+) Transcript_32201:498-1247(+)